MKSEYAIGIGSTIILFIIGSVVFVFVFLLVPVAPNQYGIGITGVTNVAEFDKVYENGLYWRPFGHFLIFPANLQSVEFADVAESETSPDPIGRLSARSMDGLDVSFRINFNFKLIKNEVIDLYQQFGNTWREDIVQISRGTLRTSASQFRAIHFFNNASMIEITMESELTDALKQAHADLGFFQLKGVRLPIAFESALERVQTAQQEIEIAQFEQDAARIRAQTLIIEAQAQANITIIEAEAEAEKIRINAGAIADQLNITITAQGEAFLQVGQDMGFNTTEMLTYMWIQAILEHDESLLIIGADTPIILDQQSTP